MPLIKSAIKKVRKDKKRTRRNTVSLDLYKQAVKKLKKGDGNLEQLMSHAYSLIDKAVKRNIIHKNKGDRLKSRFSRLSKNVTKSTSSSGRKTSK